MINAMNALCFLKFPLLDSQQAKGELREVERKADVAILSQSSLVKSRTNSRSAFQLDPVHGLQGPANKHQSIFDFQ